MSLLENWYPPTRENYEKILLLWQLYPLFPSLQWLISWYGMGKTSVVSRFNVPGRIGWLTMEAPGFLTLLYTMKTLPARHGITDLPWQNKVLASFFVMHYLYRALLFPVLQPSMSPIHIIVWALGLMFQLTNSTCIGSWLAAYGPTTKEAWDAQPFMYLRFAVGAVVFFMGLLANYYHDDELRQIRWRQMKRVQQLEREKGDNNDGKKPTIEKHYEVPNAGFFRRVLYAHYLVEWIEWTGFWIACGWSCVPARMFVINEVAAMLPRAVRGRRWYAEKFGEDAIKGRWAALPGII